MYPVNENDSYNDQGGRVIIVYWGRILNMLLNLGHHRLLKNKPRFMRWITNDLHSYLPDVIWPSWVLGYREVMFWVIWNLSTGYEKSFFFSMNNKWICQVSRFQFQFFFLFLQKQKKLGFSNCLKNLRARCTWKS